MRAVVAACCLSFGLIAVPCAAWDSHVSLDIGARRFADQAWPQVGARLFFGPDSWRVHPAVGASIALDIFAERVVELSAGVSGDFARGPRSVWSWGAGLARLDYEYEHSAVSGNANGGYVEVGVRWPRADAADYGINLRYTGVGDRTRDDGTSESISTGVASFGIRW